MSETVQIEGARVEKAVEPRTDCSAPLITVRSSPGGYFAALLVLSFLALLLLRAEYDEAALISLIMAWIVVPILAFTDRVRIEGRLLSRTGFVAFLHKILRGRALRLNVDEIERVETYAVRTLKRGGSVRYRYRSEVVGRGISFAFASGGNYRHMVRCLFALVDDEKLDARSQELRDYLEEPKRLRETVKIVRLASSSVLESVLPDLRLREKRGSRDVTGMAEEVKLNPSERERGLLLRRVANQLRAAGRLREAAEGFRRALLVSPKDGWLLYEFARFLRSQASALADARLLTRSRASLRLAARHGQEDATLLARIGESFFEFGDIQRAARLFQKALELQPRSFRAETGLAEVALRNGKLAHVIHHYHAASRIAPDEAAARFARREAEYYALLNDDDEYLSAELRRINWLQTLQTVRRLSARIILSSILLAVAGSYLGGVGMELSAVGWSVAASSLIVWVGVHFLYKLLSPRRRPPALE